MMFADVVGQHLVKEQLITGHSNGRLSHAILFAGKEGHGGLALALALSAYMNCASRTENDSCGTCPSCHKIRKLIHPDIHFSFPAISEGSVKNLSRNYITKWREAVCDNPYLTYYQWLNKLDAGNKQGNIPVEEGREVFKNLSLKAHDGGVKVQIIWMADFLKDAGNTLLKIIEEPPSDTYFLLIANNTENILNTILSRTQIFSLPPLKTTEIAAFLTLKEEIADNEEADKIAAIANGDFADALRLTKTKTHDHEETFMNWLRMCYMGNLLDIYGQSDSISTKGREYLKDLIQYGLKLLRESLFYQNNLQDYSYVSDNESSFLQKFAPLLNTRQIEMFYLALNKSSYYIEHNANSKIVIFNLSLQFIRIFKHEG